MTTRAYWFEWTARAKIYRPTEDEAREVLLQQYPEAGENGYPLLFDVVDEPDAEAPHAG